MSNKNRFLYKLRARKANSANKATSTDYKTRYIEITINVLMLIVVGYYTFCAHRQVEEAKRSNELNEKVAFANFSSTKKSLELTQDSLKATKDSLAKLTENISILKKTQNSNIVSHYLKIEEIDFEHNVPTHFFINLTNVGSVPAKITKKAYACASISKHQPSELECQKLAKDTNSTDFDFSLGPKDDQYGIKTYLTTAINDITKEKLKKGELHLYVTGKIAYIDYLGSKDFLFCQKWKYTEKSLRSGVPTIPMTFEGEWETCE